MEEKLKGWIKKIDKGLTKRGIYAKILVEIEIWLRVFPRCQLPPPVDSTP